MSIFDPCIEMLRDPSVPEHRVFRKVAIFAIFLSLSLLYFRHIYIGFGFGEPFFVSLALISMILGVIGIFGGLLAASFYRSFLSAVGAKNKSSSLVVFFAEWLFAAAAPLLGFLAFTVLSSHTG